MKLCMFSPKGMDLERGWPGRIDGDQIVQLAAQTLQAFFTGGGGAREHATYELAECDLRAPVLYPPAIRLFAPFKKGATPFFSFVSPHPVLGPEEALPHPAGTEELDYRVGVTAVIGAGGQIGGFTLANVWTARDLARTEREAGHGPAKSGDFGISLGPLVVTPDELAGEWVVARVNGEERTRADFRSLEHPWAELVEHASRNTALRPGDLLVALAAEGSGQPLHPGDVVELEGDGIGVLRNRVA
jgi:2-keto-4-pentenoate hydratase/2-oxohepta-3-ene-1,7-dioic acid hydratase in catechol pathway